MGIYGNLSSESSPTDSGVDLQKANRLYGFNVQNLNDKPANGALKFPVDDVPPPLPEKDKFKNPRTKHLSHLPADKITVPAVSRSSRTKHRTRSHTVSSTPPATLAKLLRAQESTTKETRALLNTALSQLESASARAARAEAQIRARETSAILSHSQLTENAARAEEAAARASREAEAYKLQLRLLEEEIRKERERVRAEEQMRAEAQKEAERARSLARKWRGEGRVLQAKEDGRQEGFGEGLKRGRLVIAAAIAAKGSYEGQKLVGDGAAYIEEYDEESDRTQSRRRDNSRDRRSRSKRRQPTSRHTSSTAHQQGAPSRRERAVSSSARSRLSESVQRLTPPFPVPQYQSPPIPTEEPPPPAPSIPESVVALHRARSIQTDPSLLQSERTRSRTTSSVASPHSRYSLNQHQRAPSPPQIFVQASPSPPPAMPVPELHESSAPEQEQTVKTEPFSPQMPTPQQPDLSPIPIPPPISQVPFAPGIVPSSSFQQGQYAPPDPVSESPPESTYFPMPAPPVRVIVTPADEDRDVQTPSTMTSMTNENSLKGFDFLRGFPPPPSRAGSAGSAGPSRVVGGFDPDLSTIHEHSREGTSFGGDEDIRPTGILSPDRSRNVEEWRKSLGETYSLGRSVGDSDLLRPPSSNSNSRRRRPPPLDLDLDRQLSSASTSSRSINIDIEPPSHPTSPTPHDSRNRGYSENPQDDAFLSPHHAPLALSADPDDGPVIPTIKEEDEEDNDYDDYDTPNPISVSREFSESSMYPIPIVNSLPPGFVPTPNGTNIISLQREGAGPIASTGFVTGGVPVGFYANDNTNMPRQNNRYPYGAPSSRGSIPDNNYSESTSSSSRSSSTTGSNSSSGTELGRPSKYARSNASDRGRGLTSTFPPTMMSEGGYANSSGESARGTPRTMYATTLGQENNILGGIYAMPTNMDAQQPPTRRNLKNRSQYGTVPAAAAIQGSRMPMQNVSIPEPSVPQYGVNAFPEPSVPQYQQYDVARYSTPRGGTSRMIPGVSSMPEPAVPLYPPAGSTQGQRNTGARRSLRRSKGSIPSAMPMPEPPVPQYPTSQGYRAQTPVDNSRMTPAAIPMPESGVPQYSTTATTATQRYPQGYQSSDGSRMTAAAIPMPEPNVTEYRPNVYQTPSGGGGASRVTTAAVSMPEPNVPHYATMAYQNQTPGEGGSRITPAVMLMPEPGVSDVSQHLHGTPGSQYPNQPPAGGRSSRLTPAVVSIPEPSVPDYAERTPADGASRMTAPAIPMPEPSMGSVLTSTPAGGTSRVTAPVIPMPEPSMSSTLSGTSADRTSRMTAPVVPMPVPSVSGTHSSPMHQTPAGGTSRMTVPAIPMPEPSTDPSPLIPGSYTPGGSSAGSRVTPAAVSMPEPTVPQYGSGGSQGHPTPGGGDARMVSGVVSMPEPTVPQFGSTTTTPRNPGSITMPEPTVPQFGSSPAGGSISRITAPAVPMPEPTVPRVVPQDGSMATPAGGSRITAPAMSMPEPSVPSKPLTKAQKKKQKKKGGISMPEPEIPQYDNVEGSGPSEIAMPEPSITSFDTHNTPSGGTSRMIPPTIPMPEPSSNITTPAMSMPVPSIGTPSLSMGGTALPQHSSPSMSGWGLGTPGGWGFDANAGGPGTPNTNRRASLHAGTTPVASSQPLPVPNPIPGPVTALRKGRKVPGSINSPASSVDSTTMRNTEANKGPPRSARARGMVSPWGA